MIKPLVVATMGDPAGIGPEVSLKALQDSSIPSDARIALLGDYSIAAAVADRCDIKLPDHIISLEEWEDGKSYDSSFFVDCNFLKGKDVIPGMVQKHCGSAAGQYIRTAVAAALSGRATAIATAPIHKEALNLAGYPYPGHTEMLADLTNTKEFCMMMASDEIVVSLCTIHTPFSSVPELLTSEGILSVIRLTHRTLMRLDRGKPHLLVCGLNPHGGESGLFGDEEQRLILPAVEAARAEGIRIEGPVPPDTAFVPARIDSVDAHIVMYHDQGLIPFKMLAFEKGVNITLGLPIVRTSADHGTAYDIAWTGKASASSMAESIKWALRLSSANISQII